MSWIVTIGPRVDGLWVVGKDNLTTLTHPAPKSIDTRFVQVPEMATWFWMTLRLYSTITAHGAAIAGEEL